MTSELMMNESMRFVVVTSDHQTWLDEAERLGVNQDIFCLCRTFTQALKAFASHHFTCLVAPHGPEMGILKKVVGLTLKTSHRAPVTWLIKHKTWKIRKNATQNFSDLEDIHEFEMRNFLSALPPVGQPILSGASIESYGYTDEEAFDDVSFIMKTTPLEAKKCIDQMRLLHEQGQGDALRKQGHKLKGLLTNVLGNDIGMRVVKHFYPELETGLSVRTFDVLENEVETAMESVHLYLKAMRFELESD